MVSCIQKQSKSTLRNSGKVKKIKANNSVEKYSKHCSLLYGDESVVG